MTGFVQGTPARQVPAGQLPADVGRREPELAAPEGVPVESHTPGPVAVDPEVERIAPGRGSGDHHDTVGLPPSLRPLESDPHGHRAIMA